MPQHHSQEEVKVFVGIDVSARAMPSLVTRELKRHQRYLQCRLERLRREALRI